MLDGAVGRCMFQRTFSPSSGHDSRDVEAIRPRRAHERPARAAICEPGRPPGPDRQTELTALPSSSCRPTTNVRSDQAVEAICSSVQQICYHPFYWGTLGPPGHMESLNRS